MPHVTSIAHDLTPPQGIVFASGAASDDIILRNCVNPDTLEDPVSPVEVILQKCNHKQVCSVNIFICVE